MTEFLSRISIRSSPMVVANLQNVEMCDQSPRTTSIAELPSMTYKAHIFEPVTNRLSLIPELSKANTRSSSIYLAELHRQTPKDNLHKAQLPKADCQKAEPSGRSTEGRVPQSNLQKAEPNGCRLCDQSSRTSYRGPSSISVPFNAALQIVKLHYQIPEDDLQKYELHS